MPMSPKVKRALKKILLLFERILDAMKATLKVKITRLQVGGGVVAFKATRTHLLENCNKWKENLVVPNLRYPILWLTTANVVHGLTNVVVQPLTCRAEAEKARRRRGFPSSSHCILVNEALLLLSSTTLYAPLRLLENHPAVNQRRPLHHLSRIICLRQWEKISPD